MESNVETFPPQGAMLTVDGLTDRVEIESMTIKPVSASGPGGSQIVGRELIGTLTDSKLASGTVYPKVGNLILGNHQEYGICVWTRQYFTSFIPKP